MELNEAYSKIRVTPEEEASIKRYLNFEHTEMNLLADFRPELYLKLQSAGWAISTSPSEIKEKIEDFVNIYSAMYKNSENYGGYLVRGTAVSEISSLE